MNNNFLLTSLIASALLMTSQVNAATKTGNATVTLSYPIVVELTSSDINFGTLNIGKTGTCTLTSTGLIAGGPCSDDEGTIPSSATYSIAGADKDVTVTVEATGTPLVGITFTPKIRQDGDISLVGNTGEFNVDGKLDVTADVKALTDLTAQQLGYMISFDYSTAI